MAWHKKVHVKRTSGEYYMHETFSLKQKVKGFHEENCLNQKTFGRKGSS